MKHPTDKYGALEFKRLKKGAIEWCLNSHAEYVPKQGKNILNKNASHIIYIMGIPTGFLCVGCKKEWVRLWEETSPIEYI